MDSKNSPPVWLLCIGAGPEQEGGILTAKKLGYNILAVDYNSNAASAAIADEFRTIDIKDKEAILSLSRQFNIAGVIPVPIGRYLTSVGYINDALNLKGPSENTCYLCTDKTAFYNVVQGLDILVPKQASFKNLDAAKERFKVDGPLQLLVKPTHGSGSKGVKVVKNPIDWSELESEIYKDGILIEDFIVGTSLGVDGWVENKNVTLLCIRKKKLTPLPYRVEYAFGAPVIFPEEIETRLYTTIKNSIKAIGLEDGVFHADLILDESNKIWMIEMAPRPSGLMISRNLVARATGVSILEIGLQIIMSIPLKSAIKNNGYYVLQYILFYDAEHASINSKINKQSYLNYLIEYKPGPVSSISKTPTNMSEIINNGYFIVSGKNLDTAFNNADELIE